jgi:type VI secretion system protein VasJ
VSDSELAKLGVEPIPGDNPAGEDIQFDDDYEAIRQEVAKIDSVTGEEVAWSEVIDKGTQILAEKSKHIQVGVFLCLGLFRRDGFAGLETGLTICHGLLSNYWDTMYPPLKRKRGRIEAFAWLAERGGKVAADTPASSGDLDTLKSVGELISKIESFLNEKLESDAPSLGDLRRDITNKARDIESKLKAAEAKAAAKQAAAAAGTPEIETAEDAQKGLNALRQSAKNIADFYRKSKPADPLSYRFLRAVYFSSVSALPSHKDGVTQIPGAPPEIVTRLDESLGKSDFAAVIETVENRFATSIFWLDLQRYIMAAMEIGGEEYAAARMAIADEVGLFVKRLPEAVELKFANGTPFASPETMALLEQIAAQSGGGGSAPSSSDQGGDDVLAESARKARKLAGKKKLPQAIKILQDGIAQTGEKRGQFLWRLEMARVCLEAGEVRLAVPQLEFLANQIDQHHLEEWEPLLSREVYSTLYVAQQRLAKMSRTPSPDLAAKLQTLHARLCRIDVAAALAIDGSK